MKKFDDGRGCGSPQTDMETLRAEAAIMRDALLKIVNLKCSTPETTLYQIRQIAAEALAEVDED